MFKAFINKAVGLYALLAGVYVVMSAVTKAKERRSGWVWFFENNFFQDMNNPLNQDKAAKLMASLVEAFTMGFLYILIPTAVVLFIFNRDEWFGSDED